jgi:hypothetical protein
VLAEFHGQWQADIAETHDADSGATQIEHRDHFLSLS